MHFLNTLNICSPRLLNVIGESSSDRLAMDPRSCHHVMFILFVDIMIFLAEVFLLSHWWSTMDIFVIAQNERSIKNGNLSINRSALALFIIIVWLVIMTNYQRSTRIYYPLFSQVHYDTKVNFGVFICLCVCMEHLVPISNWIVNVQNWFVTRNQNSTCIEIEVIIFGFIFLVCFFFKEI